MNTEKFLQDFANFEKSHILSGTIAAAVGAHVFLAKGFGIADARTNASCAPQTLYNIASVTKQFIAAALLRVLYDSHPSLTHLKKALKKPVSHYLPPEDRFWNESVPQWADEVTLHHLLTHTSGIVNYTELDIFWDHLYTSTTSSMLDLIAIFKDHPLNFPPGYRYEYSNSGYVVLGQVIARLCQKDLSCYLQEVFFSPLGMVSTSLPARGTTRTLKKEDKFSPLARGYTYNANYITESYEELKEYWPLAIDQGDGGIISSAEDLIRWNSALYNGDALPPGVLDLMLTKHVKMPREGDAPPSFYGYGIVCTELTIGDVYGHGGSIPGYLARLEYAPSLKLTVVSFSNVTFDLDSMQEERDTLRKELCHIEDGRENQAEFDKIFKTRYPQVVEIMEKHAWPYLKDLGVMG